VTVIRHLTYIRVAAGSATRQMKPRATSGAGDSFLLEHVDVLTGKGAAAAPAHFTDASMASLIGGLATADEARFLQGATTIQSRLLGRMDHRTAPGLLVCAVLDDGRVITMKLQVHVDRTAGFLERLDSGETTLAAIKDTLDQPGELQKIALFPDARGGSDAHVSDKVQNTALYFLNAIGLTQDMHPTAAAGQLVDLIAAPDVGPDRRSVARVIARSDATTVREAIDAVVGAFPDIGDRRTAIEADAENRPRPLRSLDPAGARNIRRVVRGPGARIVVEPDSDVELDGPDTIDGGRVRYTVTFPSPPTDSGG
jgi:hypothetical protein